jgi:hypothetical protein
VVLRGERVEQVEERPQRRSRARTESLEWRSADESASSGQPEAALDGLRERVLIGEDRGGEAAGEDPVVDGLPACLTWRAGIAEGGRGLRWAGGSWLSRLAGGRGREVGAVYSALLIVSRFEESFFRGTHALCPPL